MSTIRPARLRVLSLSALFVLALPFASGCRQYNAHDKADTAGRDLMEVDDETPTDPMAGAKKGSDGDASDASEDAQQDEPAASAANDTDGEKPAD